jgi:hypothetical protein
MSIVNRRNAVIGWLAWNAGKRIAKRKGRSALPTVDPETKRPNRAAAVVAVLAAAGGALLFWRRRSGDEQPDQPD